MSKDVHVKKKLDERKDQDSPSPGTKKEEWNFALLAEWEELLSTYGQDHFSGCRD